MCDNQPAKRLPLPATMEADLAPHASPDEAFLRAFDAMVEHLRQAWAKAANPGAQDTRNLSHSAP